MLGSTAAKLNRRKTFGEAPGLVLNRLFKLDGIISRASGCRHRINTSVFNVSSVPRIGARSTGASPKGRIRPSHSNIISMEAVMDPAGVPTVCFIRI